jgi:hypothetical protein
MESIKNLNITPGMLRWWGACWSDRKILASMPNGYRSVESIFCDDSIDALDKVWLLFRPEIIPFKTAMDLLDEALVYDEAFLNWAYKYKLCLIFGPEDYEDTFDESQGQIESSLFYDAVDDINPPETQCGYSFAEVLLNKLEYAWEI